MDSKIFAGKHLAHKSGIEKPTHVFCPLKATHPGTIESNRRQTEVCARAARRAESHHPLRRAAFVWAERFLRISTAVNLASRIQVPTIRFRSKGCPPIFITIITYLAGGLFCRGEDFSGFPQPLTPPIYSNFPDKPEKSVATTLPAGSLLILRRAIFLSTRQITQKRANAKLRRSRRCCLVRF